MSQSFGKGKGVCPDGIMTGEHLRGFYTAALNKTRDLHMWCEEKWGEEHMSYSEILEYKDDGLAQRHRLIYWLLRVW